MVTWLHTLAKQPLSAQARTTCSLGTSMRRKDIGDGSKGQSLTVIPFTPSSVNDLPPRWWERETNKVREIPRPPILLKLHPPRIPSLMMLLSYLEVFVITPTIGPHPPVGVVLPYWGMFPSYPHDHPKRLHMPANGTALHQIAWNICPPNMTVPPSLNP